MTSIGIRDLKNNLSRYLRNLRADRPILVTDRGRVVAELRVPPSDTTGRRRLERYAELIDEGLIRPATASGDPLADWPSARDLTLSSGTAAALVDEDRGDG